MNIFMVNIRTMNCLISWNDTSWKKKKSKFVTTSLKKVDYRPGNISNNLTRKNQEKKFMVIAGKGLLIRK